MKTRIVEKTETKVVGIECKTTIKENETYQTVEKLWGDFTKRNINENARNYGILLFPAEFNPRVSEFTYMACIEFPESKDIPLGMITSVIPGGKYCVITHKGLMKDIGDVYSYYNNKWLPESGYQPTGGIEFEIYDERFKGFNNIESEIDVYFPIK